MVVFRSPASFVSALADRRHIYSYTEETEVRRLDRPVLRPLVPVSFAVGDRFTAHLDGLVDTGADAVLASDLLAEDLGVDLSENEGETTHAVGGRVLMARYKTVRLRLHPYDDLEGAIHREWPAQVGFVAGWHDYGFVLLGSIGFLDRVTVTASRFAQAVAVEHRDAFDQRFDTGLSDADQAEALE
jgi:hypothetical protein